MAIYNLKNDQLQIVKEDSFKLERDIQRIFENNLELITGLKCIKSEFTIKNKRIDTLAFDEENKSFVIIEYKKDKNYSVIDQGFAYLNLMLEYKSDFILEYIKNTQNLLNISDIDWSQIKIIFVSPDFTDNQKQAVNFQDIAIELWEVNKYSNSTILINQIKKNGSENLKQISKDNKQLKQIVDQTKVYTENDLLKDKSEEMQELYERFKGSILNLTNGIEIKANKYYIAFKKDNSNIVDLELQKRSLKIYINLKKGELDNPKKLTRDISEVGHWGNGDYLVQISNDKDLEYILSLIKQAI